MQVNERKRIGRPPKIKTQIEKKLCLLTNPLSIDLDVNETAKYLEEIKQNGGYKFLKNNISNKNFAKNYSKNEVLIIQENLESLKRCAQNNSSDDSDVSIEGLQPRAAVLNQELQLADITDISSVGTTDSENEFIERFQTTSTNVYASNVYHDEAKNIYSEFKIAVLEQMKQVENNTKTSKINLNLVSEHLNKIMNLQTEYTRNEKDRYELIQKLKEIGVKQNETFDDIMRIISYMNDAISEIEVGNNDQMKVQQEWTEFGQKQREDIWRNFLKKQMEALKVAITKNMKLA